MRSVVWAALILVSASTGALSASQVWKSSDKSMYDYQELGFRLVTASPLNGSDAWYYLQGDLPGPFGDNQIVRCYQSGTGEQRSAGGYWFTVTCYELESSDMQ